MYFMKNRFSVLLGLAFCAGNLIQSFGDGMLFDFGADATPTTGGVAGPTQTWNNVTAGLGGDDAGVLENLLNTEGAETGLSLQMISRFNGANENGTTTATIYPATATRDSLFGNTELFNNLENITPVFKLAGLTAGRTYTLTFYASRLGGR
jgi:hypothetical protein